MTIKTISKRMLSLLMAMLMLCSGMAVAFATDAETALVSAELNEEAGTLTITKLVEAEEWAFDISYSPSTAKAPTVLGSTEDTTFYYVNLDYGVTYTVNVSATVGGNLKTQKIEKKILSKAATPAAPVPTNVGATSITINSVSGCEYKLETAAGAEVFAWGSKTTFDGLSANTAYVVYIRVKETASAYASDAASIGVTTLAGSGVKAAAPVLLDKTDTSVTVAVLGEDGAEVEGIEYSIDGGKTWQAAGKFTGLKKDTAYSVVARYTFDEDTQEANPASDALQVKTNARAGYAADIKKVTFKADGDNYANESLTFVVTGDAPSNIYELQYGDTKLVPAKFSVDNGANKYGPSSSDGNSYKFSFVPGVENANSDMEVIVYFTEYKYDGSKWVEVKTTAKVYDVEIGPNNDFFNKIKEGFETVLNVLLNTIPALINDFLNSDAMSNGMDFFLNLFKNLDLSKIIGALQ